ncbi:hypothetical protein [Mucilaginibacter sp.]
MKQSKLALLIAIFCAIMCCCAPVGVAQNKKPVISMQRKNFTLLLKQSNLKFTFPPGFQEVKAVNDEDFSFDFALHDPDHNCDIWLMARSQKQDWLTYEHTQADQRSELDNPDSLYIELGETYANALTGDNIYQARDMPADVLAEYNADAGKSYLLNLQDMPVTQHYKYALIVSLEKNHAGTLIAVFFTNYKDPDFYSDVNKVSHSFKFAP